MFSRWCGVGAVGIVVEVANREHEEGQVQGEEQQEEGDGGFERQHQKQEGEDEPALYGEKRTVSSQSVVFVLKPLECSQ